MGLNKLGRTEKLFKHWQNKNELIQQKEELSIVLLNLLIDAI